MASMYIRVKRTNQTTFLYADPIETIADAKAKLGKIHEKDPAEMRLIFNDATLDNDKTIADYKIDNDNVVYLVYKNGDAWEDVNIQKTVKAEDKKD